MHDHHLARTAEETIFSFPPALITREFFVFVFNVLSRAFEFYIFKIQIIIPR
jgi:hypothetical protein